jgi:hypothetical protein
VVGSPHKTAASSVMFCHIAGQLLGGTDLLLCVLLRNVLPYLDFVKKLGAHHMWDLAERACSLYGTELTQAVSPSFNIQDAHR